MSAPFLHPAIFWTGLAAAAVPILIHLLNRRRFRIRNWAAMQFLLDSLRKSRRRLRIEELILLAIRCLLVALLGAALARFTGCAGVDILPGERSAMTVVFVLDDSYSMGQKLGNSTLFSAATTDLAEQLAKLPGTSRASVLRSSRPDANEAFLPPNFVAELKGEGDRIKSLTPSDTRAVLSESLAAARKLLGGVAGPKRVYVFGDFRRVDLEPKAEKRALEEHFKALRAEGVEVLTLDYGRPGRSNLTVQGIEMLDKFAVAGMPLRLRVTVRNNGLARAEHVKISLTARRAVGGEVADVELPLRAIRSIDPDESRSLECAFTPAAPGPMMLSAGAAPDELPADNVARLALDVRRTLKVLLVDGRPNVADPAAGETFFLQRALDPLADGRHGVRPDAITYDGLAAVHFDDYDVVVLADVAAFPPGTEPNQPCPQLTALERYVREGGGVAIFTGDGIDQKFYNDFFWARGSGLSPYRLRSRAGAPSRRDRYFKLNPKSLVPSGMLRVFEGDLTVLAEMIRFFAFTRVDELTVAVGGDDAKPPRVLARLADPDGSPLLVSRAFGKGTVLTFYSTAGKRWNDWPIDPAGTFAVAMRDMVHDIARPQPARTARVGRPIVHPLPPSLRHASGKLRTPHYPQEDEISLLPQAAAAGRVLRYRQPLAAGAYTLTLTTPAGAPGQILFARNPDPDEGVLTPAGRGGLVAAFGGEDFVYQAVRSGQGAGDLQTRERKEYWPWGIAALLALLAVEGLLGQRFGHYGDLLKEGRR